MLDQKSKSKVIKKYQTHADDTGSTQVQIAIISTEIKRLVEHLKEHKKDHSSRLGLLKKIGERRRLLRYLEGENIEEFEKLVKELKLKVAKRFDKRRDALLEEPLLEKNEEEVEEDNVKT